MQTFRMWVPSRKGRADLHFRSPTIKHTSVVHIAVSEAHNFAESFEPTRRILSLFGAASITLQNVSVRDGAVDFYVYVDWHSPLHLMCDITVLDPPVEFIRGS